MKARGTVPALKSEVQDRGFWETHGSTVLADWAKARLPNLKASTQSISRRLRVHMLDRIKAAANARSRPYQSLSKVWLEEDR
jgi:hypothetical protein